MVDKRLPENPAPTLPKSKSQNFSLFYISIYKKSKLKHNSNVLIWKTPGKFETEVK